MYQIISGLNSFIREKIVPNPFEFISDNQLIVELFTYFIGAIIIYKISYAMCGIFYSRGKAPILGSIGYMVFFCFNAWILMTITKLFSSIYIIAIIYFIVVIAIFWILIKFKEFVCIK